MANLEAINERVNAVINELTRLQRALEKEIEAASTPATVTLPADEVEALRTRAAASRSEEAAAQSVALGNADAKTVAKAEEAKK